LISIGAVAELLVLQTTWATSEDLRRGNRRNQVDLVTDLSALHKQLDELVPMLHRPPTTIGDTGREPAV
jgi:hypothetical protein